MAAAPTKRWKIQLAVSERSGTTWLPKKVSKGSVLANGLFQTIRPRRTRSPSSRGRSGRRAGDLLFQHWRCLGRLVRADRLQGLPRAESTAAGSACTSCRSSRTPAAERTASRSWVRNATDDLAIRHHLQPSHRFDYHRQQHAGHVQSHVPDADVGDRLDSACCSSSTCSASTKRRSSTRRAAVSDYIPLGTFMPYFYGDFSRTYAIIPGFYETQGKDPTRRASRRRSPTSIQFVDGRASRCWSSTCRSTAGSGARPEQPCCRTGRLTRSISPEGEVVGYRSLQYGLQVRELLPPADLPRCGATLDRDGIHGADAARHAAQHTGFDFATIYSPTAVVVTPYPRRGRRLRPWTAPTPSYNWELFFHLPFEIADAPQQRPALRRGARLVPLHLQPGWRDRRARARRSTGSRSRSSRRRPPTTSSERIDSDHERDRRRPVGRDHHRPEVRRRRVARQAVQPARGGAVPPGRVPDGGRDEVHREPDRLGRQPVPPVHAGVGRPGDADLHPGRQAARARSRGWCRRRQSAARQTYNQLEAQGSTCSATRWSIWRTWFPISICCRTRGDELPPPPITLSIALLLHPAERAAAAVLGHGRRPAVQDPPLPEHRRRRRACSRCSRRRSIRARWSGRRRRALDISGVPRRARRAAAALPLHRRCRRRRPSWSSRSARSAARCCRRWRSATPRRWPGCGSGRRSAVLQRCAR